MCAAQNEPRDPSPKGFWGWPTKPHLGRRHLVVSHVERAHVELHGGEQLAGCTAARPPIANFQANLAKNPIFKVEQEARALDIIGRRLALASKSTID